MRWRPSRRTSSKREKWKWPRSRLKKKGNKSDNWRLKERKNADKNNRLINPFFGTVPFLHMNLIFRFKPCRLILTRTKMRKKRKNKTVVVIQSLKSVSLNGKWILTRTTRLIRCWILSLQRKNWRKTQTWTPVFCRTESGRTRKTEWGGSSDRNGWQSSSPSRRRSLRSLSAIGTALDTGGQSLWRKVCDWFFLLFWEIILTCLNYRKFNIPVSATVHGNDA